MVQTPKYDLFISYADADRAWVEGYLLESLKQAGVHYYSEAAFALGTVRLLEFERAIQQSQRTLLVISSAYLADGFNQFVDFLAQCYGFDTATWPVIPLILEPVKLPPRLSALVRLNATNQDEWKDAIKRLCIDLKQSVPAASPKPDCPYPGMFPFKEANSDRFFGRDEEVKELIERLRLNPLIAVIGPSGSGKSSLVFAGLIPALRGSRLFGSGNWLVRTMRPGEKPLNTLENELGGDPGTPTLTVTEALRTSTDAERLLLIVDQFEEVFTLAGQEAVPFQSALLRLIEVPNCYLILTVRADFYPDLMGSPLWQKIQSHRLEIVPLDEAGLREAVVRPAEDVGVFVELSLVERLVTDASGEPGVLPLIQETLVLLWEKLEQRFLPLRAYEALVLSRKAYGALGSHKRTGLQVAIARRADAALANLSEPQQAIARRIFLRLIQFGQGRADTRRQQPVDALSVTDDNNSLFYQTLRQLADSRLLTLSGEEDSKIKADIAHEALISGWPKLQQWITERREAEQTRRRLAAQAAEWVRLGQGSGGLLDEVELAEAEGWLNSSDASDLGIDPTLLALVEASARAIQEAKQREEEARQRELEHIKKLLAEEEKAREAETKALSEEMRARKAAQLRNRVITASSVVLFGLTVFAFIQWNDAQRQKVIALNQASEALLPVEYKQLEALVTAMQAGIELKKAHLEQDSVLKQTLAVMLEKTIYRGVQERNRLVGHSDDVNSVSFSPNGNLIASASKDQTIRLWSRDGKLLHILTGHGSAVNSVSFSPDNRLATGNADGTIQMWSQDGQEFSLLKGHGGAVNSVSFSPDNRLVAGNADGTIQLWSQDGKELSVLKGHGGAVNSVSFSPDNRLAAGNADGTIQLWSQDGKESLLKGHSRDVSSVSFSSDGMLASASYDATIILWSSDGKQLITLQEPNNNGGFTSVNFSPDGKTIASASYGNIQLWDRGEQKLKKIINGHNDDVVSVGFSPDGKTLASASRDNTVKLWGLDGQEPKTLTSHDVVSSVSFSRNGNLIASASKDQSIRLWSRDGKLLHILTGHGGAVNSVSFGFDSRLAAGNDDGTIQLWSQDGQELSLLHGHGGAVRSVSFNPDNRLAAGNADGTIQLWSQDGKELSVLKGHGGAVNSVSFSPDNRLAAGNADGTIQLWSQDGQELPPLKGHTRAVNSVSFSPDGKMLTSASDDATVKLWSLNAQESKTLIGSRGEVNSVIFSPDGKTLVSAGKDPYIELWSLDGQELKNFVGQRYGINSLSFSPDGKTLVSAGNDKTLILWNFDLDNLLGKGCNLLSDYLKSNPNDNNNDIRLFCK